MSRTRLGEVTVAVVGAGGWGRNLIRNFAQVPACRLKTICDHNPKTLAAEADILEGRVRV